VSGLRPGDIVRARDWPDTLGRRYLVRNIQGGIVHAFEIDGRYQDGTPRGGRLRSFPVANVERMEKAS